MTNPNPGLPSNEEIVNSLHELELEGSEQETVTSQVVEFIATQKTTFDGTVASMQKTIDDLTATQMPSDIRELLNNGLKTLKTTFDGSQNALTAAITAPTDPIPEPTDPSDSGDEPRSRGRSSRKR